MPKWRLLSVTASEAWGDFLAGGGNLGGGVAGGQGGHGGSLAMERKNAGVPAGIQTQIRKGNKLPVERVLIS